MRLIPWPEKRAQTGFLIPTIGRSSTNGNEFGDSFLLGH